MKDLPKVFAKPIDKEMRNNEEIFYSKVLNQSKEKKDILREIDKIFGNKNFVYKSQVEITLPNETIIETIVGKSGTFLLTIEGKKISIPDIIDIKKL